MPTLADDSPNTHFINVDLDIYSRCDLRSLVDRLGRKVFALYVGRDRGSYTARLELSKIPTSADSTIRAFCALIRALPKPERDLWNSAKRRDFSIGVQAGKQPFTCDFDIEAETVKAVSELAGRIVFTVYAPEEPGQRDQLSADAPRRKTRSPRLR